MSTSTLSKSDRAILTMTQADIARFLAFVDKTPGQGPTGECHVWTGGRSSKGYGWFRLPLSAVITSRVGYFLANGHLPPPEAPFVCHSCDWPPCCNRAHLFAGTNADNMADAARKGRLASGDRSGSRLHPERLARGLANGHAASLLTDDKRHQITCIFELRNQGLSHREIGASVGMRHQNVGRILGGKVWSELTADLREGVL